MPCKIPLQIVLCSVLIASIKTSFEPLTPLTNGGHETNTEINSSHRGPNIRAPAGNVNSSGVDKLPSNLDSLIAKKRSKRVILFRPLFVYRQQQARKEVLQRKFNLRRSGQRADQNKLYPDHHRNRYPDSGRREPFNCYC